MTEERYDSADPSMEAAVAASGALPVALRTLVDKVTRNAAGHDSVTFAAAQQKNRSADDLNDNDHAKAALIDGADISPMRAIAQSVLSETDHPLEPALTPPATRSVARQAYSSEH